MNFKEPKQVVISNAYTAAQFAVNVSLSNYQNESHNALRFTIERAIGDGIRAAIESLVKDIYTDEEFERDINLRT